MRKNGPFALAFHTLVILFVLAPLAIVVRVDVLPLRPGHRPDRR
ncbi:ABC transporter permease, partial [Burkholderia multivorans]